MEERTEGKGEKRETPKRIRNHSLSLRTDFYDLPCPRRLKLRSYH